MNRVVAGTTFHFNVAVIRRYRRFDPNIPNSTRTLFFAFAELQSFYFVKARFNQVVPKETVVCSLLTKEPIISSGDDDDDDGGGTLYYVVKPLLNLKHNYECSVFIPTSVCLFSRVS